MISLKSKNWVLNNIETIIFDKDGTFIDLHYFWGKMTEMRVREIVSRYDLEDTVFNLLCLKLGYDPESKKMLSDGITALYSRSKIIEIFVEDLKEIGLNLTFYDLEGLFDDVANDFYKDLLDFVKPIEEAIDFIKKVKKMGLRTGIVTADSLDSTNLILNNFGWKDLFDVVIGRESSSYTKESGIPLKMAIDELNANPDNTIMIGDAPTDAIAAKNAGVKKSILVATGQVKFEDLLKNTNYVVNSLSEILTLC